MRKLSIAFALMALTSAQAALADGVAAPARTQTVSVFDGESLLARIALPSDVTTVVKSDSAKGDGVHETTVFFGNAIMEVKRDGRPLMLLGGDRIVVENSSR